MQRPRRQTGYGFWSSGQGSERESEQGCVSTAGAPGVGELAQESRWKGRAPGLENKHI